MTRSFLDFTLPTLAENLALDEALLLEAEEATSTEVLRWWEWTQHAVVLGASGSVDDDVDRTACERDGVAIHRRASGGGTVLLGPGCLVFSLVLDMNRDPALRDVHGSFRSILGRVIRALRPMASLAHEGISDLAAGGFKISGSAQHRKQRFLLHHATILYNFDISAIARYLCHPRRQPDWRMNRPHECFVGNANANAGELKKLLLNEWNADTEFSPLPMDRVTSLVAERFGRSEWIYRR